MASSNHSDLTGTPSEADFAEVSEGLRRRKPHDATQDDHAPSTLSFVIRIPHTCRHFAD